MPSRQQPRTSGPQARLTKAERKEQARRERIELQRRMARARRNRTIAIVGVLVVGVAVVAGVALLSGGGAASNGRTQPKPLPGLMTGPAPWSANLATLPERLDRLNLPAIHNPLALHEHAHLDLSINGSPVTVPAQVGFGQAAAASLHTHDDTGVIHMETSEANATFTLGDFFDVWGLRLTPDCIGGYCDGQGRTLRVFVEGKAFDGNPRDVQLQDHQEIVIAYGTEDQVPNPLPTFDWSKLTP